MHYEQRAKDRMVTDEHPGYDARAHWCGEDAHYVQVGEQPEQETTVTFTHTPDSAPLWVYDPATNNLRLATPEEEAATAPRPNLRRVRAWAEWAGATWRIVKWLAVFALGVLVGAYAESAVWR